MKDYPPKYPDARRFRSQATGIGQTRQASEQTGNSRSERVINGTYSNPDPCVTAKPDALESLGYPAKRSDELAGGGVLVVSPVPLKRAGR